MPCLPSPPKPSYVELEAKLHAMAVERANRLADSERIIAWLDDPKRRRAVNAFTEGPERQLAYRFEDLLRRTSSCENPDGTFHTSENTHEDGSVTWDVWFSSGTDQILIAEPPTRTSAESIADALNKMRRLFLDCGSNQETIKLANAFQAFVAREDRKKP